MPKKRSLSNIGRLAKNDKEVSTWIDSCPVARLVGCIASSAKQHALAAARIITITVFWHTSEDMIHMIPIREAFATRPSQHLHDTQPEPFAKQSILEHKVQIAVSSPIGVKRILARYRNMRQLGAPLV